MTMRWAHRQINKMHCAFLAGLIVLASGHSSAVAQSDGIFTVTELDPPVALGAREPSLFSMHDGRIVMSWTEPVEEGFAVKTSIRDENGWSAPQIVVVSGNLFVNWADFPSVAALTGGRMVAHWLMQNGSSTYDYDVQIALSADEGQSWRKMLVPHRDQTQAQHGFVTLLPLPKDRVIVVWLDGRAYDAYATDTGNEGVPNAMQLRATVINADEKLSDDTLLDARTCTCCQTSAAVTADGVALVVYRDRTEGEVRDISLVRWVDDVWSDPKTVHADGWVFSGCPINGPAIDTEGKRAVVAWFTEAQGIPAVNVVFSDDAGLSFGDKIRIDQGEGVGRVDVLQLKDGSALVSWVEWTDAGEALMVCLAREEGGCGARQMIAQTESGSLNFPRMVQGHDGVYIAWTEPLIEPSEEPERDLMVRLVRINL